jgi:hypothetical protein
MLLVAMVSLQHPQLGWRYLLTTTVVERGGKKRTPQNIDTTNNLIEVNHMHNTSI